MVAYLSLLVAYPPVEVLALQAQEVVTRLEDATLDGDGSGGVDVVPGDHAHCDPSTLALLNGVGDLRGRTAICFDLS